jgi:hypothetical protein
MMPTITKKSGVYISVTEVERSTAIKAGPKDTAKRKKNASF